MIMLGLNNFDKLIDDYIMLTTTDLDGFITYASKRFCKMSGYTKEELIGQNHNIVRHPDMPASIFKAMWAAIEENKTWKGEIKNLTKEGKYYWAESVVSPIFDQYTGEKIGYRSLRFDITGYKELNLLQNEISNHLEDESISKETLIEIINKNNSQEPISFVDSDIWEEQGKKKK